MKEIVGIAFIFFFDGVEYCLYSLQDANKKLCFPDWVHNFNTNGLSKDEIENSEIVSKLFMGSILEGIKKATTARGFTPTNPKGELNPIYIASHYNEKSETHFMYFALHAERQHKIEAQPFLEVEIPIQELYESLKNAVGYKFEEQESEALVKFLESDKCYFKIKI